MDLSKLKKNIYIAVGIIAVVAALLGYSVGNSDDTSAGTISAEALITDSSSLPSLEASSPENHGESDRSRSSHAENHNWGNPKTLQDHFDRHGGDFGAADPQDYAGKANEFYQNRDEYLIKTDEHGVKRIYDPETNTFGAYNKNGSTRSFFKPSGNQGYFDRQPGKLEE